MKYLPALAFCALVLFGQSAPRTVYLLPMAGGLDQYLAQSLTQEHVMKVVADPKIADTVLTDRLGEAFEQRIAGIHPGDDKNAGSNARLPFRSARARGTVFLVDVKSREVLWSDHEKAPNSNSDRGLNREAERIVKKLQTSGK